MRSFSPWSRLLCGSCSFSNVELAIEQLLVQSHLTCCNVATTTVVVGGGNGGDNGGSPVGACDPNEPSLYPDPDDCTKYYQCSNGLEYLRNCPAGLNFSPSELVCDWPAAAGCGGNGGSKCYWRH